MGRLEEAMYEGFPANCMPTSFPRSLHHIELGPETWSGDLPIRLKELSELRSFFFCRMRVRDSWKNTQQLAEIFHVDTLRKLEDMELGPACYYQNAYSCGEFGHFTALEQEY